MFLREGETGGAGQSKAVGTYADGSTQDLTNQVTYTSDNTAVAKVDASGKVTAGPQPGTATITVTGIVLPGQRPTGASVGSPAAPPGAVTGR